MRRQGQQDLVLRAGRLAFRAVRHHQGPAPCRDRGQFPAVGNPAPPRPVSPDCATSVDQRLPARLVQAGRRRKAIPAECSARLAGPAQGSAASRRGSWLSRGPGLAGQRDGC